MQNSRKVFHFRQPVLPEKCFHDVECLRFKLQMRAIKSVGLLVPYLLFLSIVRINCNLSANSKTRNNIDISENPFDGLQSLRVDTHSTANIRISVTFRCFVFTNELKPMPS